MVGEREVIIGRETLEAADKAFFRTGYQNVVNGRRERFVIIIGFKARWEAIMVSHRFIRILNGDIVRVLISVCERVLNGKGFIVGVEVTDDDGGAVIFGTVFCHLFHNDVELILTSFIGIGLIASRCGVAASPPKVGGNEDQQFAILLDAEDTERPG